MIPELILVAGGALSASGLGWWWNRRARRAHVRQVRTGWVRGGQIVQYGPVGAVCLGARPQRLYRRGVFGALGITDDRLAFDGHRDNTHNLSVDFDRMRRIGLTTVTTLTGRTRALTVHFDSPDGWRVATFVTEMPVEIAQALSAESGLPVRDSGDAREDFGPARATRMTQNIYGEWTADRSGDLYLAPDRLLFNWRDAIPVARIHRVDVFAQGSPLESNLLRVEFATADDETDVVGFLLRRAMPWAEAVQRQAEAPVTVQSGRKRKRD